jgi:hypothetical protein
MTSNQPRLLMSTPGTSATEQEMDFPTFGEILAPPPSCTSHRRSSNANAPTMECDRVNLRRSVPVQKRQQIFETVPVRHRGASFG